MRTFAERFADLAERRSPLCVGLDPSEEVFARWELPSDVTGLRRFCDVVLEAVGDRVAVVKPQAAFFERFGPLGMAELAEDVFHMPARVGAPQYDGGLADVVCQPRYSTAMGLVMEGAAQRRRGLQARDTRSVKQVFGRMKAWFERNF